jgi:elongation factor Ts
MAVTPAAVKELRDKTGAGMMECKKALVDAGGDMAKAEKLLKESGLAAAAKRMSRTTNEGRIFSRIAGKRAAMLELTCETDFVARNSDFVAMGNKMLDKLMADGARVDPASLEAMVGDIARIIKENMGLRRFKVVDAADDEMLVDYIHGEGRIGVILKFRLGNPAVASNPKVKETTFDLALHVAAFAPAYLSRDKVDPAYIAEQEAIFRKQVEAMDKPENVLAGIIKGKVAKHLSEICLLEQGFVKDEKIKVQKVLEDLGKQAGGKVELADYLYFKVGQ